MIEHRRAGAFLTVTAIALVAGASITISFELTRERIAANERARLVATLHEVLPAQGHDNDLLASRQLVVAPHLLGTDEPVEVFVATRMGEPVAALIAVVAPGGYNGPIGLLVGVAADGELTGVRVLRHRETPGLGDAIEIGRSDWIAGFTGRSLGRPAPPDWRVRKDGGEFDALTGATVTPRAVVAAVRNTLIYFRDNAATLFASAGAEPADG